MTLHQLTSRGFKGQADQALADSVLQGNLEKLKHSFLARRARARESLPEFDDLRDASVAIKKHTIAHMDLYLEAFETAVKEAGGHLLDHTAVLFGSNLGNASSHSWHNLPILLAGGGYKHGHHVAHDPNNNTPFANLFVPLAQRMGLEIEKFGSSTKSTIRGLQS